MTQGSLRALQTRRTVAIVVLAVVISAPAIFGWTVYSAYEDARRVDLAAMDAERVRLTALADRIDAFEADVDRMRSAVDAARIHVRADTAQLAPARLQSRISAAIEQDGGDLARLAFEDAVTGPIGKRMRLTVEFEAPAAAALRILENLESGAPLLLRRKATLAIKRNAGSSAASARLSVTAAFDAFIRLDKG